MSVHGAHREEELRCDGFYGFLAERLGATARCRPRRPDYRAMDAMDVRSLEETFDVVLCFGILHRVTDPIGFLRTLADVVAPGGELVIET